MIETDTNISPSGVIGLRTGTVYYPDGRVEYTGPLKPAGSASSAPLGGDVSYDPQGRDGRSRDCTAIDGAEKPPVAVISREDLPRYFM